MKDEYTIISKGENILLRDGVESDVEIYVGWWDEGEWQEYDAPWEVEKEDMSKDKRRRSFRNLYMEEKEHPRKRALISTTDGIPIGWVNRYSDKEDLDLWYVGIDICEDEYLGKGFGTEALQLWIDYLLEYSDIHKIAIRTYSYNSRMQRVAEKLGFVEEGTEREIKRWGGKYIHRIGYGLLRREWDE
ncbi:MAG: GNAT family protein [Candidatus Saliniplasma sp.]